MSHVIFCSVFIRVHCWYFPLDFGMVAEIGATETDGVVAKFLTAVVPRVDAVKRVII